MVQRFQWRCFSKIIWFYKYQRIWSVCSRWHQRRSQGQKSEYWCQRSEILMLIFLVFHQRSTVHRVHCKMFFGSTTGVATHSLSNQAVMNFRDLRNIEAAVFIPACFALPYITSTWKSLQFFLIIIMMAWFMRVFQQNALAPSSVFSILLQCIRPHFLSCICVFSFLFTAMHVKKSSVLRVGVKTLLNTIQSWVLPWFASVEASLTFELPTVSIDV